MTCDALSLVLLGRCDMDGQGIVKATKDYGIYSKHTRFGWRDDRLHGYEGPGDHSFCRICDVGIYPEEGETVKAAVDRHVKEHGNKLAVAQLLD